jgi:AcrR family transcriptional regulator
MTTTRVDRAALVRRAMVELVADKGIHGTSMSQVARHAGVATGTAYVHYESKEELLVAAFVEVKEDLGRAALVGLSADDEPRRMFGMAWKNIHAHLASDPAVARFLIQVEASPLRGPAHDALGENALAETAANLKGLLVELPDDLLYELGFAPAVRIVAAGTDLGRAEWDDLVESCWRAITR